MSRAAKPKVTMLPAGQFRIPAAQAWQWRVKHNLTQPAVDRLLGFTSLGRAARRWETDGAPPYVEVLMAYIDKYGPELAEAVAKKRDSLHEEHTASLAATEDE